MIVIDGLRSLVGGMNIADRYNDAFRAKKHGSTLRFLLKEIFHQNFTVFALVYGAMRG